MTKAKARGYIDIREGKKGTSYRVEVRVRDKNRPTGYYEKNASFETIKKAEIWRDKKVKELDRYGIPTLDEEIEQQEKIANSRLKEIKLGSR